MVCIKRAVEVCILSADVVWKGSAGGTLTLHTSLYGGHIITPVCKYVFRWLDTDTSCPVLVQWYGVSSTYTFRPAASVAAHLICIKYVTCITCIQRVITHFMQNSNDCRMWKK